MADSVGPKTVEAGGRSTGELETDYRMKILTALSALQIVAIAFLLFKVVSIDESIGSIATGNEAQPVEDSNVTTPTGRSVVESSQPDGALTSGEVRRIVREELRAQIGALASSATGADSTTAPDPYDEIEYQQRYELVDQELEFFIDQGTISDSEMAALQMEIAKLDAQGRKQMLRRLTQALNSGELDGRL